MKKSRKWISRAVVFSGLILVFLLIFTINSEPLVYWFRDSPQQAIDAGQTRIKPVNWYNIVGSSLIGMLVILLLMSHLGLLFVVSSWLNKPHTLITQSSATCPNCKYSIQNDWAICPKCGTSLRKTPDA